MYRIYHLNRFLVATTTRDIALDYVNQSIEVFGFARGDFEILDQSDTDSL
jgi:hypothetical protein